MCRGVVELACCRALDREDTAHPVGPEDRGSDGGGGLKTGAHSAGLEPAIVTGVVNDGNFAGKYRVSGERAAPRRNRGAFADGGRPGAYYEVVGASDHVKYGDVICFE